MLQRLNLSLQLKNATFIVKLICSNPIIPSATSILIKSADIKNAISISEPAPKSQMLRVPTVLIPIVRERSLRRAIIWVGVE
jgi:hypothetical protein